MNSLFRGSQLLARASLRLVPVPRPLAPLPVISHREYAKSVKKTKLKSKSSSSAMKTATKPRKVTAKTAAKLKELDVEDDIEGDEEEFEEEMPSSDPAPKAPLAATQKSYLSHLESEAKSTKNAKAKVKSKGKEGKKGASSPGLDDFVEDEDMLEEDAYNKAKGTIDDKFGEEKVKVSRDEDGMRLDRFLRERYRVPQSLIEKSLRLHYV